MTAGIRVLDGHMHLLTTETKEEERNWLPPMLPVVAEAARRRAERYEREQAVPCSFTSALAWTTAQTSGMPIPLTCILWRGIFRSSR